MCVLLYYESQAFIPTSLKEKNISEITNKKIFFLWNIESMLLKLNLELLYSLKQFWEIHICVFSCDVIVSKLPVPDYNQFQILRNHST